MFFFHTRQTLGWLNNLNVTIRAFCLDKYDVENFKIFQNAYLLTWKPNSDLNITCKKTAGVLTVITSKLINDVKRLIQLYALCDLIGNKQKKKNVLSNRKLQYILCYLVELENNSGTSINYH